MTDRDGVRLGVHDGTVDNEGELLGRDEGCCDKGSETVERVK